MRRLFTVFVLLLLVIGGTSAQTKLYEQFGQSAREYANRDLSMFRFDLCQNFTGVDRETLNSYFTELGSDWGNVALALTLSQASGSTMGHILTIYDRTKPLDWNKIAAILSAETTTGKSTTKRAKTIIKKQLSSWQKQIPN